MIYVDGSHYKGPCSQRRYLGEELLAEQLREAVARVAISDEQWESNGWLKAEPTSQQEIKNLLAIAKRDLKDATGSISPDWQFGIAYNAALRLCAVLLRAQGYRPAHGLQHYRTIMAMPLTLGESRKQDAEYRDTCRTKRNIVEYDYVGGASEGDAKELLSFVTELKQSVMSWLKEHHPELR